jgi:hypothetical protein
MCVVVACILHDKTGYCQTLFNSSYITGISVLCYWNMQFVVSFPFLFPLHKCRKSLRGQKRKKLTIFLLFRKLPLCLVTDYVCQEISLPFDSVIGCGIHGQSVTGTAYILYLILFFGT